MNSLINKKWTSKHWLYQTRRLFCDSFVLSVKADDERIYCGLNNGCVQVRWQYLENSFSYKCLENTIKSICLDLGLGVVGQGEGAGVSWQRCQVYWCQQGCCADWKLWCHVQSRLVRLFQFCQYFSRSGASLTGAASKHFHVTLTVSGTWSSTTVSWSVYTHCPPPDHWSQVIMFRPRRGWMELWFYMTSYQRQTSESGAIFRSANVSQVSINFVLFSAGSWWPSVCCWLQWRLFGDWLRRCKCWGLVHAWWSTGMRLFLTLCRHICSKLYCTCL